MRASRDYKKRSCYYPKNPRSAVAKFARFGKTCGIAAALTPNHFAIVAPY
jgi:hypothetical protein